MSQRISQINSLIQHELGQIIHENIELPENHLITITKVQTSKDIKYAKIFVSLMPENQRGTLLKRLTKAAPLFQKELAEKMLTKFSPKLNFVVDENEIYASEIDKLLDSLKESW